MNVPPAALNLRPSLESLLLDSEELGPGAVWYDYGQTSPDVDAEGERLPGPPAQPVAPLRGFPKFRPGLTEDDLRNMFEQWSQWQDLTS